MKRGLIKEFIVVLVVINILTLSGCTSGKKFAIERLNTLYDDNFEIVKVKDNKNFIVKSEKSKKKEFNVKVRWGNTSESPRVNLGWIMETDYVKIMTEQELEPYKYDGYSFKMDNDGDIIILLNDFTSIDNINDVIQDLVNYTKNWRFSIWNGRDSEENYWKNLTFNIGSKSDEGTSILTSIESTETDELLDISQLKQDYLNNLRGSGSSISKVPSNFIKENPVERAYVVFVNGKKRKLYNYDTIVVAGKLYFDLDKWIPGILGDIGYKIRNKESLKYELKVNKDVYTLDKLNDDYYLKNDEIINFKDRQIISVSTLISIEDMENILECKIDFDIDAGKNSIRQVLDYIYSLIAYYNDNNKNSEKISDINIA